MIVRVRLAITGEVVMFAGKPHVAGHGDHVVEDPISKNLIVITALDLNKNFEYLPTACEPGWQLFRRKAAGEKHE